MYPKELRLVTSEVEVKRKMTRMEFMLFSAMAIIGKVVGCFFPALLMNFNLVGSLRIGVGMVPRCEVVLIIAGIAATSMMKNPALEKASGAKYGVPSQNFQKIRNIIKVFS